VQLTGARINYILITPLFDDQHKFLSFSTFDRTRPRSIDFSQKIWFL